MNATHAAAPTWKAEDPKAGSTQRTGLNRWSWRVGRIAGIDLYIHATMLILLAWVAVAHVMAGQGLQGAAAGIALVVILFTIVTLHELGHALTARRFGIRTRDITLLPIGGASRLERMPDEPWQELLVAVAGPAVNVVLAIVFFAAALATGEFSGFGDLSIVGGPLLMKLVAVNVSLAVFNLLPAFPMDGGRVLRAALAMRMDYVRATEIAAHIGQGIALALGLAGLFFNPFLVFVALFVWMGAHAEASMAQLRGALAGIPVAHAMVTRVRTFDAPTPLESAVPEILSSGQQDFPVTAEGRLVGVLQRDDVLRALAHGEGRVPVGAIMQREFETADPREMFSAALEKMQRSGARSLPVVHDGALLGMILPESVGWMLATRGGRRSASA
jgi:Zn-dependent protease